MKKSTDTPVVAVGMALQTLLRNAKEAALLELISPSTWIPYGSSTSTLPQGTVSESLSRA